MKGFKGYSKDLKCRNFQYEIGKDYETNSVKICSEGFHFCENPLDVLSYYPLKDGNKYTEVEGDGKFDKEGNGDSKICVSKIKIGVELDLKSLINSAVKFIFDKTKIATSGDHSHSATSGDNSNSATSGDNSHSATSGKYSHSATSGYNSHSATSGYNSHSATIGDNSHSATSGDYSHSATSGYHSNSATSGDNSHSSVKDTSIASATGFNSKAKGELGCWIVIAEWSCKNGEWTIITVKSVKVDGKKIKANTWYKVENKKFVETGQTC